MAGSSADGLLGELDAVHFGHDDVGQEQVETLGLEQRHGLGPAADGGDLIADALQRPLEVLAHRRVVFGQQDSCHRPLHMRASFNIFQPPTSPSCVDRRPIVLD